MSSKNPQRKKQSQSSSSVPRDGHMSSQQELVEWRVDLVLVYNDGRKVPRQLITALATVVSALADGSMNAVLAMGRWRYVWEPTLVVRVVAPFNKETMEILYVYKKLTSMLLNQEAVFVSYSPIKML